MLHRRAISIFLSLVCYLLVTSSHLVWADTILLKNGNRLQGKVVSESGDDVVIEVAFGKLTLPKNQIAKIMRDSPVGNIIQQGERLISLGAMEHALAYFDKAISDYPGDTNLRQAIARVNLYAAEKYMANKQFALAKQCMEVAKAYDTELATGDMQTQIKAYEAWGKTECAEATRLLNAKEPAAALQKFLGVLEIFPEWERNLLVYVVQAAVSAGDQAYGKRQFADAAGHYETALKYQPEILKQLESRWVSAQINWLTDEYINTGCWSEAQAALGKLLKVLPANRPALFLQGFVAEKQGNNHTAFALYQKILGQSKEWSGNQQEFLAARRLAQQTAGFGSATPPEERYQEQTPTGKWSELKTQHFHIFHENASLAQQVGDTLEYHWQAIQNRLAPKSWQSDWRKACQVYIYPSREQYKQSTGMFDWSAGATRTCFEQGRLYVHAIHVYQGAELLLARTLPHELTHVLVPWFLGYKHDLPLWLGEGVAMTSEPPFQQTRYRSTLTSSLRCGKLFSLAQLFQLKEYPKEPYKADILYAQSFSVTEFLLQNYGMDRLWQFAASLPSLPVEKCVQEIFGLTGIEELERVWRQSLVRK